MYRCRLRDFTINDVPPYTPASRIEGRSKYSLGQMRHLTKDRMFSFSIAPLRLGFVAGYSFFRRRRDHLRAEFLVRGDTSKLVTRWSSLMMVPSAAKCPCSRLPL